MYLINYLSGGDKLVNLWYMKHIAEEFRCQVHVNEKYFNFVKSCLPEFAHAFSPTNSDGFCRFHFNCSNSWGLEFEEGCAPSFEDPQDFQVKIQYLICLIANLVTFIYSHTLMTLIMIFRWILSGLDFGWTRSQKTLEFQSPVFAFHTFMK